MLYFDMPRFNALKLFARGWTKTLIERFLPVPDGRIPVDHPKNSSGQIVCPAAKVWSIERRPEFEAGLPRNPEGTEPRALEGPGSARRHGRTAQGPHPKAPPWTKEDVRIEIRVGDAAGLLPHAGAMGDRTPHKC